jgi:hypothetical protein
MCYFGEKIKIVANGVNRIGACPSFLGSGFALQVLGSSPLRCDGLWAFRYNPSRKQ